MRLVLTILAVFAIGAILGLLAGLPFHHAGGWYWWAGGGAVAFFIGAVCWFVWDLTAHGNIIASWLVAACAALLLANPVPARADSEARVGADWVRITALPCTDPAVLALLEQAGQDAHDWRAAAAEFGGVAFAACWRPDFPRQIVHMVYGDADQGVIPFGALEPLKQT